MVLSLAAETICLLSAEKATESTSLVWSSNLRVVLPGDRSHSLRVLSQEPDRAKCPSDDRTPSEMKWECPWSLFWGTPYMPSSLVSFQTMRDLSLEEDRIISGYLGLVVIWVTQSLWPLRVPLSCNVSVISLNSYFFSCRSESSNISLDSLLQEKKMPSVSVKDVSQQDFTVALAAHFKKTGKMKIPEWVDLIKTNVGKELAPYDE